MFDGNNNKMDFNSRINQASCVRVFPFTDIVSANAVSFIEDQGIG